MENARQVAEYLRSHAKVAGVTYLGFLEAGSRQRAVYDRQCKAAGSTFSFCLHGGEAEAFRMLDRIKLMKLAVSLGGSETLICHSATTTHYAVPPEKRLEGGITEGDLSTGDVSRATAAILAMVESPLRRVSNQASSSALATASFVADFALSALLIDRRRLKLIRRVVMPPAPALKTAAASRRPKHSS